MEFCRIEMIVDTVFDRNSASPPGGGGGGRVKKEEQPGLPKKGVYFPEWKVECNACRIIKS